MRESIFEEEEEEVEDEEVLDNIPAKRAKIDTEAARQEKRVKSGTSIVIKNVSPFLALI